MTTRATAILNCKLEHDPDAIRARLDWALPEVHAVRAYWHRDGPKVATRRINTGSKRPAARAKVAQAMAERHWIFASRDSEGGIETLRFRRPEFGVWVIGSHAEILTSCRWTGFMTIDALRWVHVRAFHRIGSVLKAKSMLIIPSGCNTQYLLWSGALFEDAVASLEAELGPPQASVDFAGENWQGEMSKCWFFEDVIDSTKS